MERLTSAIKLAKFELHDDQLANFIYRNQFEKKQLNMEPIFFWY